MKHSAKYKREMKKRILFAMFFIAVAMFIASIAKVTGMTEVMGMKSEGNNDAMFASVGSSTPSNRFEFEYTGDYQEFIAPETGSYKFECWGAQGGDYDTSLFGGKGGYTSGVLNLTAGDKFYVYVGGQPPATSTNLQGGYNGGGNAPSGKDKDGRAGGGATDIRLVSGDWNDFDSLKSRIMVAGGGGGAAYESSASWRSNGGAAGGLEGCRPNQMGGSAAGQYGTGGTQTSGGYAINVGKSGTAFAKFGIGGNGISTDGGTGGGGGYYGGGGSNVCSGGGGGSSFISNHTGCDAITQESTESNITHTGNSTHYSRLEFDETVIIDGEGYEWTSQRGGFVQMKDRNGNTVDGNIGDGFARITLLVPELVYSEDSVLVVAGGNYTLNGTFSYNYTRDDQDALTVGNISYQSLDTSIATVNSSGVITGVSKGNTKILLTDTTNGYSTQVSVRVRNSTQETVYTDLYVSKTGNDVTGDGSYLHPLASIEKAIELAEDGNTIFIDRGNYSLTGMYVDSYSTVGIWDQNKRLTIVGQNEETVLAWDGNNATTRDGGLFTLGNANTVVRNISFVFTPKAGSNYQKAIFRFCSGSVENAFIRISGGNSASYIYNDNGGVVRVKNTTFFHDRVGVDGNYSGTGNYADIATNVNTSGTNNNVVIENFGTASDSLRDLIDNSSMNNSFNASEVGVFSGQYTWDNVINVRYKKKYSINLKNEIVKVGSSIKAEMMDLSGQEADPDETNWTWKSYDTSVATVSPNGTITGASLGHTVIEAFNTENGSRFKIFVKVCNNNEKAITVPQVESGANMTIVLKEDGTVWSSGYNAEGQLGDGSNVQKTEFVQVKIDENTNLTNVTKISVGYAHTVALTKNGEVYVWGWNGHGQLGQNDTTNRFYATKVKGVDGVDYLQDIIDVAAGDYIVYAVNRDGNIYGIGNNDCAQINEVSGSKKLPTLVTKLKNAVYVTSGYSNVGIIQGNGETWIKGHNAYGVFGNATTATNGGTYCLGSNINDFCLEGYSGYILKEDNTVWGCGYNNYGQLGLKDNTNRSTYTQILKADDTQLLAKRISGGAYNFTAVGTDGKVYVAGYNGYYQLGDKTTSNRNSLITLKNDNGTDVEDAFDVKAGECVYNGSAKNIVVIRNDGTVWNIGNNENGQIGNGSTLSVNSLVKMGTDKIVLSHEDPYIKIGETIDLNIIETSGLNVFNQGGTVNQNEWTWKSSNDDVASVNSTTGQVTGRAVGYTTITGQNNVKGLKARIIVHVYRNKPGAITTPDVQFGTNFTVALKEDGTVWTSGYNNCGQLGNGTTIDSNFPVQVKIDNNTNLTNVKAIACRKI